ncbi:MAG: Gfo/Idh/MocA family oxidoreductase [Planctomycetes bacterium]|nr:Gfo/Idh/MocA family oxidoreductase [Planctomycetota bacterium]
MLNVAVVGCGYWGPNIIRNLYSLPECNVRMICDTDEERLRHMKTLYADTKTTTNYDDLVNDQDIDAIFIATPVRFHFEMAKKSLQANKHTFIEKPMARSVKECEELVELAEKQGLILMIGHTFIYSEPVRKIKSIIDSGDLGDMMYISSRRLNLGLFQKDINVTWDLAPHEISIILFVLNESPSHVNCQGKAHITEGIEDITNMTVDFHNGCFATIQSSWLDPNKVRETTFVGSKRMLVYNDVEPMEKIKIYDKRVDVPPHYDTFAEFQYSYHYGDTYSPYLNQAEPLKVECQHFLECIKSGAKPDSSGSEGLKVVQILEASTKSLSNGGGRVAVEGNSVNSY